MASMGTESASSSSATHGWEYDVFLSFRGTDTRTNFTGHLYDALVKKGIVTFRDDEELERGTIISPGLMKAIEESRFAVVILSRNYASSSWCLSELAKIIECMKKTRLIVLPVFHYVDPSDVWKQRGTFAEAFVKHKERFKEDVDTWRAALEQVASIAGFDLRNRHEPKVIEEIVGKISSKLTSTYSIVDKDLVGINSRMEELVNLLGMGLNDVRFIGIWGMGGIGKTTLARVVYERFHDNFDGSSFLANVREESGKHGGLVSLQKQLLSDVLRSDNFPSDQWRLKMIIQGRLRHKRVLVILDDVDQLDQLEALAGEQSWFGQGSRIIITTRDQHQLIVHQLAEAQIYKLRGLNNYESLKLFSQKAFNKDHPPKGYEEFSQKFIYYAQGLPLALKVLGSSLIGRKSLNLRKSALQKFQENPPRSILDVLQKSFDGLEEREKNIFLDIACFFVGDEVTNIVQTLYNRPDMDIDVLLKKSLITISNRRFEMHDLLQELGKEIVRRESPIEPGGRSRLWRTEDILHVLKNNTGTKQVQGIVLKTPLPKNEDLDAKAFSKMKNLRILEIRSGRFPQGLTYLPNGLLFLNWHECPLELMPTGFQPNNLVQLRMRESRIKQLWRGVVSLNGLKLIDLDGSQDLIEIPDLSGAPNLEILYLRFCKRLSKIDPSFGNLKCLIEVDMRGCTDLQLLPELPLNIEYINGDGCTSLETLAIRPEDDFHPSLSLLNCVKLIGNQGYGSDIFLTMLRHYFQKPDCRGIDVFTPGSEIPKWFRHQSVGASMEFVEEGPSDFMGIAVCAVFVRNQHLSLYQYFHLDWYYSLIAGTEKHEGRWIDEKSVVIDSYNLWLGYFPFKKGGFEEGLSPIHIDGDSWITVRCKDGTSWECSADVEPKKCEVTKCGARLVDKKAIEDLKQSMTGCSMIPYDGDELGTTLSLSCGEAATSNDVDVPHPKGIRLLNLNETACEEEESSETASCHESPRLINFFSP